VEGVVSTTTACRSCGSPLRRTLVDLGEQPLANSYLTADELAAGTERRYPLIARVCDECWLVQVDDVVAAEEIFSEYAYFSSYSTSWVEHARRFAERAVRELDLGSESLVVEVASNDGYLLRHFADLGVPVLGIEPAANVAKAAHDAGIPTEVQFCGAATADALTSTHGRADLVVANNVMAHVPDLNDFVAGLSTLLAPEGLLSVEVHSLLQLLQATAFDTIYHEHFSYFSVLAASPALERSGLRLVGVEQLPTHGGSIRLWGAHAGSSHPVDASVAAAIDAERHAGLDRADAYQDFSERVDEVRTRLRVFLDRARADTRSVVAYGAAAKGNTLLNACNVTSDDITYVVDRNEYKQGRFLPGSHLEIRDPGEVEVTKPDFLVILPWNLSEEITEQMRVIAGWGGRFVVPIPSVEVLT
jgi:SAM-dependent methyltransferase